MIQQSVFNATKWKVIEKFGTKGIQFIIQLLLARLLTPEDYGIIAIITVFIALANVFVQHGFSSSLIQKKEVSEVDMCTALFTSLGIALFIYIVLFISAPYISDFYNMKELTTCIRVLSLILFAGSLNSIQYAYVSRKLQFKLYTVSTLSASLISGLIGILMAMGGYGVWALIAQQVINYCLSVMILNRLIKWRIKLKFSFDSLRALFSYGGKILGSSLINSLYTNIYNLVIGSVYSKELLGLYNRGQQIPLYIADNINETVQSISFPILSQSQDNRLSLKRLTQIGLMISTFVVFPAMLGLSAVSKDFVAVFLGEKWSGASEYMSLICFVYSTYPIHTMNLQFIKATGRSDLFLKLEILKRMIETIIIIIVIKKGLKALILGQIFLTIISIPINVLPTKRTIGYGIAEQIKDIFPTLVASVIMYFGVVFISHFSINAVIKLVLEISGGIIIYIVLNALLKNQAYYYLISKIPPVGRRK